MVKKRMYQQIQKLKKQGFNQQEISATLQINRKTVGKYYGMSEDAYREYAQMHMFRDKILDAYESDILEVYSKNNCSRLNMAAVYDYLEEIHGDIPCSEKSLRNFIGFLIGTGKLVIKENIRMYKEVPELPFGQQMQLDFGEYRLKNSLKLYIVSVVLSASRYKFAAFQDKPFTTECVIQHLLDCFDFFGGIPEELVIDQDSLMVVSENKGDIVYTKKFDQFIHEMDLKMYVCRKADPESKGKIENVIKYIKKNFLSVRDFEDSDAANKSLRRWLKRRANGRISRATKSIPAVLFEDEKKCLRSTPNSIFRKDSLASREERSVNDKSFISVGSSLYSVPVPYKNRTVEIYQTQEALFVFDQFSGKEIAEHALTPVQGRKIVNRAHFREQETSYNDLKEQIFTMYDLENWKIFVEANYSAFPRYTRDQCVDAKRYFQKKTDTAKLDEALALCIENKTWSFRNLYDTYLFFLQNNEDTEPPASCQLISKPKPLLDVHTRSLCEYRDVVSEEAGL